jgi:hypothetical protein
MADYSKLKYDSSLKDPVIDGEGGMLMPRGASATRDGTPTEGLMRYNTELGLMEQYNATGWAGIDAPPTVSSFTGVIQESTDSTLTITGTNFKSGSIVSITGDAVGGIARQLATTFVSSTELTAATGGGSQSYIGGASYNIVVSNPSGLSAALEPAGNVDQTPVWNTSAGTLATVTDNLDGAEASIVNISGTDYRVWAIKSGAGNFVPPTTTSNADVLIVGGGGGGGYQVGGGGGAGGVVWYQNYSLTAGSPISYKVGIGGLAGGASEGGHGPNNTIAAPPAGGSSFFGGMEARGGGCGSNHPRSARCGPFGSYDGVGQPGGCGGGGAGDDASRSRPGGASNQPSVGGATVYGTSGGTGRSGSWAGGGGGGATSGGSNSPSGNVGGPGGAGVDMRSFFGTGFGEGGYFAGGGGGCSSGESGTAAVPGGIGGGGDGYANNGSEYGAGTTGGDGLENTGGGGGGVRDRYDGSNSYTRAGNGGSGIILIRYPLSEETGTLVSVSATDPDGTSITYSLASGSLPTGVTLNTSTGALIGRPSALSSDTNYPFTINASSNNVNISRAFNIQVNKALDGSSASRAASSAEAIKNLTGTTEDGIYWINVNGTPTRVYCLMSRDSGGWMLGMNINTNDGHVAHYSNTGFWQSATQLTSYSGANSSRDRPTSYVNDCFARDFKAIEGGNLWNSYNGTKFMVMVHNNGSYVGYRSWNLNTSVCTRFSQFWAGTTLYGNPSSNTVNYYLKITNGSTNSDVGNIWSKTPNSYENADLITNANNYNNDRNRLTQVNSGAPNGPNTSHGYSRGDNAGAGFGTYYDTSAGGRPESDAQSWDSGTWSGSGGRFGRDTLENSGTGDYDFNSWGGKPETGGGGDTYNWNGYSGYDYDFAMFIK